MTRSFDEQDSTRGAELPVEQEFEICLRENPTAGFRWALVQDGSPICALVDQGFAPGLGATGQAGVHTWKFKIIAAGQATIELAYRRSWESAPSSSPAFVLHVTGTR